jgi:hypothetical protein
MSVTQLSNNIRRKTMEIRTVTSITFHWVKGHTGLEGNKTADYLARTIASYNPTISYDAIPVSTGKEILEDYYTKIWNGTYVNSEKSYTYQNAHSLHLPQIRPTPMTKLFSHTTNHGCFRSYFYKMEKVPISLCNCPEKSERRATSH